MKILYLSVFLTLSCFIHGGAIQAADEGKINSNRMEIPATARDIKDVFPDYEPKRTPDTATDLMPSIDGEVRKIPPAKLENFTRLLRLFNQYAKRAKENPGTWEGGNIILGADPREYRPSPDELLTAIIGDRLREIITSEPGESIQGLMKTEKLKMKEIAYKSFTFRHVDVMGSGRFFYVKDIETVRIALPNAIYLKKR